MHFSTIFAATALAGAAVAEMHTVAVSNKTGALVFMPDSIKAAEGDTVMFKFWPKNHSVAQSTFAKPCDPMEKGFWSGYVPTESTTAVSDMTYTYTVKNASAPIWFYCTQGKHCQSGMVGVINPPATGEKTLAAFKNASMAAKENVTPKSEAGTGGKLSMNGTSASGSSGSSASGSPSASGSGAPQSTGAASHFTGSVTFAGLSGLVAFLMV